MYCIHNKYRGIDMGIRRKITIAVLFVSVLGSPVYAQKGFSIGAGAELNLLTLEEQKAALGGVVNVETRMGPVFAMGVNIGAGYGWNGFISIENRIFGRWYFARLEEVDFFIQTDAGLVAAFLAFDMHESRGSPSIGIMLGSRLHLSPAWYLEPYIRGGYPYLGGVGILVGRFLPPGSGVSPKQ